MADYMENVETYPVKSQARPGEIISRLPDTPPSGPEDFSDFMHDLDEIIMPGISHWQSPSFFAYFPANTSPPSILAEMITATLGAQCMIWETSPAAAELEEKMMIWLRDLIRLPKTFEGVIQDSASTSTLAAILTAREKATDFKANDDGAAALSGLRIYCSEQTHSSIEKAVKISGIGRKNLVRIPVRKDFTMDVQKLRDAIENDKKAEEGAVKMYNDSVRLAVDMGDNGSRELFESILKDEEAHLDDAAVHGTGEDVMTLAAQQASEQEANVKKFEVDVRHLHQTFHREDKGNEKSLPPVVDRAAEDHPVIPGGGRDPVVRVFRFQAAQQVDAILRAAGCADIRYPAGPLNGVFDLVRHQQPEPCAPDIPGGSKKIALPPPPLHEFALAKELAVFNEQAAFDGRRALVDEDELLDPHPFLVEQKIKIGVGVGVLCWGGGLDAAHPQQFVQRASDGGLTRRNGVDGLFDVFAFDHEASNEV